MRRTFRSLALPLAFGLLAIYLTWRVLAGGTDLSYYAPQDYVQRADQLIARGFLEAVCEGENVRIVAGGGSEDSELDREWYEDSYLRADVDRFNADPDRYGWTFLIDDDCRLRGVNPQVHTISLPFARRHRWLGTIFYGGEGSDAALRSARRSLFFQRPQAAVAALQQETSAVGGRESVRGESVLLLFGGVARPAARLYHVGEEVVVNNRLKEGAGGEVRLLGRRLPAGRISRLEASDWLHLGIEGGVSETFVYTAGEPRPVASTVRRRNDAYFRETADDHLGWVADPSREEWRPLLDAFAQGVDRSLEALSAADPQAQGMVAADFDLELTLRRDLQTRLDDVLHRHLRALSRQPDVRDDFEAGVTVMDGRTGDVLAASTWPWPEDVDAGAGDDERTRRRRLFNQNFVRHPVGSAAKPFLFAAVAHAHPFLLGMEIDEHEAVERHPELLHCWLPLGYQLLEGHYGTIDFRRALEISCNKYTVELAALSLAAEQGRLQGGGGSLPQLLPPDPSIEDWPPPAGSGLRFDGRPLEYAPDFGRFLLRQRPVPEGEETAAVRLCDAMDQLESAEWRYPFEAVTGASTYRGKAPALDPTRADDREHFYASYVTQLYDLRPWRPLLARLSPQAGEAPPWAVRAAFQEVSPERVNLAFNNVTDLRRDFVSLALGGASSVWTNLQMAEAMSRLASGRRIETRLVRRTLPEPPAPPAGGEAETSVAEDDFLPLRAEAREAVLDGLARVVTGTQGTARVLRPTLAAMQRQYGEDDVFFYSKTGSPVLERPVSRSTAQALERMVPAYVNLEGGRVRVRLGSQVEVLPARGDRSAFARLLSRALAAAGVGGDRDRMAWRLITPLVRFERQRGELELASEAAVPADLGDLDGPVYAVAGKLRLNRQDPLFTRRLLRDKGAVYVFTVVRVPRAVGVPSGTVPTPAQLAADGVQIRTVALHLTVGPDSEVAVETARQILQAIDLFE